MQLSADDVDVALAGLDVPAELDRATEDDIPRLAELSFRRERMLYGQKHHTLDDINRDFRRQPSRHWLLAGDDGEVVVWVGAVDLPSIEHVFGWFETAGGVDDDTGRPLVRFAVDAARQLNPKKGVHVGADVLETDQIRWLEQAGGRLTRRFGRMEVKLDPAGEHAQPPELPPGVEVRNVEDTLDDWHVLYDVIDTAFADHFGHVPQTFEHYYEEDHPWVDDYSLCWVASVDGKPAAALLGKQRPGCGYVGVLATLREFRGRGLATLLLRISFAEFAKRGETVGALNVDLTNPTGAVGVYEAVGMSLVQTEVTYEYASGDEVAAQASDA